MKRALTAIAFVLSVSGQVSAQEKPLWELDEVVVSDTRLKNYAEGHKLSRLTDNTIQRGGTFLTALLAFNSNIYFKENGFGMISSPAFRGTNASHTAVIWNGININSPLNGQVDFNTINPFNYSSVDIRSGGGSVQFGTGAIGGSVHLNNELRFEAHFDNQLMMGYGSFDTKKVNYGQNFGNGKWSHSLGLNYTESDNDYKYLETDDLNRNGEFQNVTVNFNAGYLLSDKNVLRLYHQSFIGDRNLSGNLVTQGRNRYEDDHYRTQLEWVGLDKKSTSKLKLAHLYEGFKYFENKDSDTFSQGNVTTLLARYSHDVELSEAFQLNSYLEYDHYRGDGSSFGNPQRNDVSLTALLKHKISEDLVYNFGLRKDFSSDFSSPLVFSLDGRYRVGEHYSLQLSASRNFRMPTFNDLYWKPGGNLDLVPESSYQIDFWQRLEFGPASFNLNGYYIATNDMIRWLPNGSGLWSPSNVDEVRIYGLESELALTYPIQRKQNIAIKANYAYTISRDKATGEQLIYVPFHRANVSIAYTLSKVSLFYQHLYNGPVSIVGGELEGYQVANTGITYSPHLKGKLQYSLGLTLNNIFNTYYENVALRPMPNRNIQTQLLLNFKTMRLKQLLLSTAAASFLLTGCNNDDGAPVIPEIGTDPLAYENGIIVVNEGGFMNGNASISFIPDDLSEVENDIFGTVNQVDAWGDTAQSMAFNDELAYIVVNGSQKVEVVNRYTFESMATIGGPDQPVFVNPRYMAIVNGKGYVTNWGVGTDPDDDFVAVVNLETNTVETKIPVTEGPERILAKGNTVYVAMLGGFNYNTSVAVIDAISDTVTGSVTVAEGPNSLQFDADGNLWVLSSGNLAYNEGDIETAGQLHKIETTTNTVTDTFPLAVTEHPEYLSYDDGDFYYILGGSIFKMDDSDTELPKEAEISEVSFYDMTVNDGKLYGVDAKDFASNGTLEIYDLSDNSLIATKEVGINPGSTYFNGTAEK